ncbi:E3 ubiquitin-protein ligase TM129 [Agrilus planipennis]|uniref:E3 ubiquitin-protein ligase TM129 n=1 Tax=Agrilus planipennis TaxID=224129 RepID=A0A1W4WKD7_AGRPL|nr:E3 ubiquitin-protein ligase TM129 [Agrilus planipennis]
MNTEIMYTLFYLLLTVCVIYPPSEFISLGFTIPSLFTSLLGSESEEFIAYHIKRSILTLFVYSVLPLGYIVGLWFNGAEDASLLSLHDHVFWKIFGTTCIILPLLAAYQIIYWSRDNWRYHPIAKNISHFCNNNSDWISVASNINSEFRSIDKTIIQTSSICEIVATENWILKITPFTIFVAHQSDTRLVVNKSDTHHISQNNEREVQYVTIEVKSFREGVGSFVIRLNAMNFRDLQNRLSRTIEVLPNIIFHKNILEKFIDAFKEEIQENIRYLTNQELDSCIGCMQTIANVKLQKLCTDSSNTESCGTCYCKPMWCVDCMARWFASRQDNEQPDTWLSSRCTCPMCRVNFCILDVCLVEAEEN